MARALLNIFFVLTVCARAASAQSGLRAVESIYADLNDANAAVSTIDSGYASTYAGHDRQAWQKIADQSRKQLTSALAANDTGKLSPGDARAVTMMRAALASASDLEPSKLRCTDAQRDDLDFHQLSHALYACFSEIGDHLKFKNHEITRGEVFGQLESRTNEADRKAAFLALSPLYEAINGDDRRDSAYRRLIKLASAQKSSEVENAAKTLGVSSAEVESWLVQILEAWRRSTPNTEVEPWNYRFANGEAGRLLDAAITRDLLISSTNRYYRDLNADLQQLGVIEDIDPRPGKSPVAYTDFAQRGRLIDGKWRPTIARVLATYQKGSLGNLNEYVHENGHAVQISAIHTRPAFMDWGDTLFVEAFADVTSWNTYDPAWQKKYLGKSAPKSANQRDLFGGVMLDVAWALFEIRMLHAPDTDPNEVWSDITNRYLHIKKHPELSWWAVRGQLVDAPGYMVNYGLGAILTADLRGRITSQIGPFVVGNPRWYPWLTENLLRFGTEQETSALLRRFLGRPVSPDALLQEVSRMPGAPRVHEAANTSRSARLASN
jgi:hypothetical protein